MIFLSCPPVYHLPGTWTKCKEPLIHHGNLPGLSGDQMVIGVIIMCLGALVLYGLHLTFGGGRANLKDQIKEHAKMHELGIAHGHEGRAAIIMDASKDYPKHKHDE
tara:strand:- start:174 stop:491 length:318 start_codon:yes stop_codon:yes gene_type:complete